MTRRALGVIGLFGAVGGAMNAWLCYAKIPVPAGQSFNLPWHVVPAGAAHGGLLAVIPVVFAWGLSGSRWPMRWAALPLVGWLCGWVPFIPINLSLQVSAPFGAQAPSLIQALFWPFRSEPVEALVGLWQFFGAVGVLYYAGLNLFGVLAKTDARPHVALAVASGVLGSFWWWKEMAPWYFSLLHGTIWGALVGYGVWKARSIVES